MTARTNKKGLAALLPEIQTTTPATKESAPLKPQAKVTAPSHFTQLERKETRLRQEQLDGLEALTKRVKRSKSTGGERITDNTLIRVAVDLLLSQADQIQGSTETELRKSVGL